MNALEPRCQTALGRTLCALLHTKPPPPVGRTSTREFLRPPRGPHNALECRVLALATVALATLAAARLLQPLPLVWRFPLALVAAPFLLQLVTLTGILLTRPLPAKLRPAATSHFLLGTLTAFSLLLLPSPWTRWPAAAWLLLCLLNITCAACERLSPSRSS